MLALSVATLVLLAAINYLMGNKSAVYPAFVFCASWAAALLTIEVFHFYFYPLLPETIVFFIVGALLFSLGSWLATRSDTPRPSKPPTVLPAKRVVDWLFWIVILLTPVGLYWLYSGVMESGLPFLVATRNLGGELNGVDTGMMLFGTLGELALFLMLMIFYDRKSHPKKFYPVMIAAFILSVATGSKAGPMSLVAALIAAYFLKTRAIRWKLLITTGLVAFLLMGAVNFYSHFGEGETADRLEAVAQAFPLYESGGLVGFDRVMRDRSIIPHFNQLDVMYQRAARKLGSRTAVVPDNSEFVKIGPDPFFEDNVYTFYWNYLNWGFSGALLAALCIGFMVTKVYHRALQGHMLSCMLLPCLIYSVAFSTFTEYFESRLYFFFKLMIISWAVYYLPLRWRQFRAFNIQCFTALSNSPRLPHS
jgi:oligosaccharide repeat unit polymerase